VALASVSGARIGLRPLWGLNLEDKKPPVMHKAQAILEAVESSIEIEIEIGIEIV
jgi:hypothetical protein